MICCNLFKMTITVDGRKSRFFTMYIKNGTKEVEMNFSAVFAGVCPMNESKDGTLL